MKNSIYRILSYGCIVFFPLYWAILFILALPPNKVKVGIIKNIPRFHSMVGSSWSLFTPPHTTTYRMYYFVKNSKNRGKTDTLEVMEAISKQKQKNAPFNQRENIIDHLVNNNLARMLRIMWSHQKMPSADAPGTTDSAYIASAIAAMANDKLYLSYLATLHNYCEITLKEKNIDTAGKEVKIVIKRKMIRPFTEINNLQFIQQEILVFESPFKPVHP